MELNFSCHLLSLLKLAAINRLQFHYEDQSIVNKFIYRIVVILSRFLNSKCFVGSYSANDNAAANKQNSCCREACVAFPYYFHTRYSVVEHCFTILQHAFISYHIIASSNKNNMVGSPREIGCG